MQTMQTLAARGAAFALLALARSACGSDTPNSLEPDNIQAEDALTVAARNGTFVEGDIQVKRRATARIENSTINGNLQIAEFGASLVSSGNRIGGDLQVFKNRGGVSLNGNRVSQALQCKENSPAPTGSRNVAGDKEDQCRRL